MSHSASPQSPELRVNDRQFVRRLKQVQGIKKFLFDEKPVIDASKTELLGLCGLDQLRYGRRGRLPTPEEWTLLDRKLLELNSLLEADQRRKIRIRELRIFFKFAPILFLIFAVLSIVWYLTFPIMPIFKSLTWYRNVAYLFGMATWGVTQGGLGACAFIGTHVTIRAKRAVADRRNLEPRTASDLDVDEFSDEDYLRMRIVMGCLFGFIFGFPTAPSALGVMITWLYNSSASEQPLAAHSVDFALLLIPFLAGFNSNLVLTVLNRFVSAVQILFGVTERQGDESRSTRRPSEDTGPG